MPNKFKMKRIAPRRWEYSDFEINKIGSYYCIEFKWVQLKSDELLKTTRTLWGAKRFLKKNGEKLVKEAWATHYHY